MAEFQWFSGLSAKAARAAIVPLGLGPIDENSGRLATREGLTELREFTPPKTPVYRLIPPLDSLALLRRDHASLLDAVDALRPMPFLKGGRALGGLADLPTPAIVDRGRIVGLWEYDPERQEIAWASFIAKNKELEAAVERTAEFLRTELGDARSFSLDSPKSRQPRIEALRAAGR